MLPAPPTATHLSKSTHILHFSATNEPAITVEPGTRLVVDTYSAFGTQQLVEGDFLHGLNPHLSDPATGPIAIAGAEPGDTLLVHIENIVPASIVAQGIIPGLGVLPDEWPEGPLHLLEVRDGILYWLRGLRIPIRPNIGVIGVAPPLSVGPIRTIYPGDHGGNMDTKKIAAGATLHLPVFVPGALLALGDVHCLQGDGELCGVAPEGDAVVTLTVDLIKGAAIPRPRLVTATACMALASAITLEAATALATRDFVDWLVAATNLTRYEAYLLVTIKADIEICQVVDPLMTVRVVMDRAFFDSLV